MNKNKTSNVLNLNPKLEAAKKPAWSQGDLSFDVPHKVSSPTAESRAPRTLKSDTEFMFVKGRDLAARAMGHNALKRTVAGFAVAGVAVTAVMLGAEGVHKLEDISTASQIKDREATTKDVLNDAREHPDNYKGVQATDSVGILRLAEQLNPNDDDARDRVVQLLTSETTTFNASTPDNIDTNLQEGTIYVVPAADITATIKPENAQIIPIVPEQLPR